MQEQQHDSLLPIADVIAVTSLSRPTIYRMIGDAAFPAPVKIRGLARWSRNEVNDWIERALFSRALGAQHRKSVEAKA